jgi:hypothetical protein
LKQLRLKLVIAKALAGQMNEIKGWIEAAGRALEHSALVRPSESRGPSAPPLITEHYGKTW